MCACGAGRITLMPRILGYGRIRGQSVGLSVRLELELRMAKNLSFALGKEGGLSNRSPRTGSLPPGQPPRTQRGHQRRLLGRTDRGFALVSGRDSGTHKEAAEQE